AVHGDVVRLPGRPVLAGPGATRPPAGRRRDPGARPRRVGGEHGRVLPGGHRRAGDVERLQGDAAPRPVRASTASIRPAGTRRSSGRVTSTSTSGTLP